MKRGDDKRRAVRHTDAHTMHAPAASPIDPDLLLSAYRAGIFPMADARDDPEVFWVEPRMRAILPLDGFRLSSSLARTVRRERFAVTCNAAFEAVIEACAESRKGRTETWISGRIAASYRELHRLGRAHSIECWQTDGEGRELVGGLYGVGFDRVFCGESMFSTRPGGSKIALAGLAHLLAGWDWPLIDAQVANPHLALLGARELPRPGFAAALERLCALPGRVCSWRATVGDVPVAAVLAPR